MSESSLGEARELSQSLSPELLDGMWQFPDEAKVSF